MLYILFTLSLLCQFSESNLKFVLEIFRHGARNSLSPHTEFPGELTEVGQRQHYLLGAQLRKEYIDNLNFLSKQFNQTEINVMSSDKKRTIQSAVSQLYGLYPLQTGQEISKDLAKMAMPAFNRMDYDYKVLKDNALPHKFQPIPVHVSDDFLMLDFGSEIANQLFEENRQSKSYQDLLERQQPTIETFKRSSGLLFNSSAEPLWQLWHHYDNIIVDHYKGEEKPKFLKEDPELEKNLKFIHEIGFYLFFFQNKKSQALFSEPFYSFLNTTLPKTQLYSGDLKWQMLSAHDTNIALLHSTLNITNHECLYDNFYSLENQHLQCREAPAFSSNLIFEFYEEKEKYVKVRYNGEYVHLCERKSLWCGLDELQERISYLQESYPKKKYHIYVSE